ncbi:MAG: ribonucleoside-diphosphate reductase, adenosylcobalamin-dependent, partial [Candidatus Nitrosomaritimum aestuariumsis]
GSRHKQVLHMTSENATKIFEVSPSEYMTAYVTEKITNPYIKSQVNASLALKVHDEEIKLEPPKVEEVSEDRLCPTCKNNLVFVEGCSICIECGYSGCTSG